MITHFAEYELPTVSIEGAKQVYADRLGFDILERTDDRISFCVSALTTLSFQELFAPLKPAHFAFTVPFSKFERAAEHVRSSGVIIARWPDGTDVAPVGGDDSLSMYFRDGDGNILEIIAYKHIPEDVLPATGLLQAMYLREIGFPAQSVADLRTWLLNDLRMTSAYGGAEFDFVLSGTAYMVTVSTTRPWIPIAMRALPPQQRVVFGAPDRRFVHAAAEKLEESGRLLLRTDDEVIFRYDEYVLGLLHTPDVPAKLSDPDRTW